MRYGSIWTTCLSTLNTSGPNEIRPASIPQPLDVPAKRLDEVLPDMEGLHKRYMNNKQLCRKWANMASGMDIDMNVPQHGRALVASAVREFVRWIGDLPCGIDLMGQANYRLP
jgi:flavorubredoxin